MLVATVHLSAWLMLPLGGCAIAVLFWYWVLLSGDGVPDTRCRIRRASLVAMFVGVIVIVRALAFVDPVIDPSNYAVTWGMSIVLVLLIVILAFIDMMNNLRIHRRHKHEAKTQSREQLAQAVRDRQCRGEDITE